MRKQVFRTMVTVVASAALMASCGGGGSGDEAGGGAQAAGDENAMISQLTFPLEGTATPNLYNFNPYSAKSLATNYIFERPLLQNKQTCEIVPWLASKYEWTDPKTLVMTAREGVKWSDGQPYTAKDLAFSYQITLDQPATDRFGLTGDLYGKPLKSVTQKGNTVTLKFGGPAALKMQGIVDQWIIPEHIYGKQKNIPEFVDNDPVTTGPLLFDSWNGRKLVLKRNADYWNGDQFKLEKLIMEGQYDATSAALKLQNGQLDAYWGDIQNPEKSFVAKNPKTNGFYYAPGGVVSYAPQIKGVFEDLKVREAVMYAMDKKQMSLKGSYGIMDPASQSMLRMPFFADEIDPEWKDTLGVIDQDVDKAKSLLDEAGWKAGANGVREKDGKKLKVTLDVQAGWLDFIAFADIIVRNLKDIGFEAKTVVTDPNAIDAKIKSGDFQSILSGAGGGGCYAAIALGGQVASWQIPTSKDWKANTSRYINPEADKLVKSYESLTDPAKITATTQQLTRIYMTDVPYIPLVYAPIRIIYRMDRAVGWPSKTDPYATGSDIYLMLMHLRAPAK